jgi:hypothetical protein
MFSSGKPMSYAVFGLVFLSDTKPQDLEMFDYCADWKLPQYKRFLARKMAAAVEKSGSENPVLTYLPHEPVGFISNASLSPTVTFNVDPSVSMQSAKFLTLKLSNANGNQFGSNIQLEHVKICGRLSTHPLSMVAGLKSGHGSRHGQHLLGAAHLRQSYARQSTARGGHHRHSAGIRVPSDLHADAIAACRQLQKPRRGPASLECAVPGRGLD